MRSVVDYHELYQVIYIKFEKCELDVVPKKGHEDYPQCPWNKLNCDRDEGTELPVRYHMFIKE